ncbi:AAA family ATPase [Kineococcus sp. GCM10028916]|uniref:AAA family ATPase n=1 Tax=Kineococcus sp. GCM10028916 TaxID=3273394 RepID=UPI00362B8745
MRLHRLVLDDFRGVRHRELTLPDTGVVVLEGANEVGKSSMLEALDMLLTEKHSSKKASVLAVKPVHRDAPSAVEAEISTGPYRFTLRKQWHSRPATTLTVHRPRLEQLTGDDAHRRVRDILTETLDTRLWDALRMLQGASLDASLSGSSALAAALDAAAGSGEDHDGDGAQTLLDAIGERYAEFWTSTGRPTSRHRTCAEELAEARVAATHAREALDLLAEDSREHAELSAARRTLQIEVEATTAEAESLVQLVADLGDRRSKLLEARTRAEHTRRARAEVAGAQERRSRAVADVHARALAVEQETTRLATLTREAERARAVATTAASAATEAAQAADDAQDAADGAQDTLRRSQDGATLRQVRRRLAAVTTAAEEVRAATEALARHRVDAAAVRAVEVAADTAGGLRARAEAVAARVVVEATAVEVLVDGVPVPAGTVAELSATRPLEIDVAGFAAVRVLPGADTGPLAEDLERAERDLAARLEDAGVEDVAAARAAHEERRSAQSALDLARAHLTQLSAEAGADELRAEVDRLAADLVIGDGEVPDLAAARTREAETRETSLRSRRGAREAATTAAAAARHADALAGELATRTAALEVARTEVEGAALRLEQSRAEQDDDALARALTAADTAADTAAAEVADLEADLAARDADATLRRAQQVQSRLTELVGRRDGLTSDLLRLEARLSVMGGEARQEVWDEAESRVARLEGELESLTRRAAAARLLRDTLERHRGVLRRRYVSPFADRLEELGRTVYGESFRIGLDDELRILDRTLEGRTVPYEQLSTGAREQLAVLTRLACATLVDPADGVPVVLDDALGHSDPLRLQRLGVVFERVAPSTQVLLLTPGPGVHTSIAGATVIRLDPEVSGGTAPTATTSTD